MKKVRPLTIGPLTVPVNRLYSRVGFVHQFHVLSQDETRWLLQERWNHLGMHIQVDDFTDQEALAAELSSIFAVRPLAEWLELFDGEDVCVGPVATLAEAAAELGLSRRTLD